jgi:hypothetical protein
LEDSFYTNLIDFAAKERENIAAYQQLTRYINQQAAEEMELLETREISSTDHKLSLQHADEALRAVQK